MTYRPVITIALIIIIVTLSLLHTLSPNSGVLILGAVDPLAVRGNGEIYRLLTAMFLHDGLLHVLLNANFLYIIGLSLEGRIGHRWFLLVFLIGGIVGNLFHAYFDNPTAIGVGASGTLYALIGADMVWLYRHRHVLSKPRKWYLYFITAISSAGLFAGLLTTLEGFPLPVRAGNWAHVGGLFAGLSMGWIINSHDTSSPTEVTSS